MDQNNISKVQLVLVFVLALNACEGCYVCDVTSATDPMCNGQEPLQLCPDQQHGACMIEAYRTEGRGYHVVKRCLSACPVFVNTTAEHIRCCTNVEDCNDFDVIESPGLPLSPNDRSARPPNPRFRYPEGPPGPHRNSGPSVPGHAPEGILDGRLPPKDDPDLMKPPMNKFRNQDNLTEDTKTTPHADVTKGNNTKDKVLKGKGSPQGKNSVGKNKKLGQSPKHKSHRNIGANNGGSSPPHWGCGSLLLAIGLAITYVHH